MITYKYRCWIDYERAEITNPDYMDGCETHDFVRHQMQLVSGFLNETLVEAMLNPDSCKIHEFNSMVKGWEVILHSHISQAKFDDILSKVREKMNLDLRGYSGFCEEQGISPFSTAYLGTTSGVKCAHDYVHKQYLPVGDKIYSILECTICNNPTKKVVR